MSDLPFIHEDFLLQSDVARSLYHGVAKKQPILDYHCHLSPRQIAANHQFRSMTELWLAGDHYKWRAMRANGENERFCTGSASDWEKFQAWARVVPDTLRNPLFHWTHLELAFPFGIRDSLLNPDSAEDIYQRCNERLKEKDFFAQGLMESFNVKLVCTTDDPVDSLEHHIAHSLNTAAKVRLLPTWRPDAALAIENVATYNGWITELEAVTNSSITRLYDLMDALKNRHEFFHQTGCRLSDHGLDRVFASGARIDDVGDIFLKVRNGQSCSKQEELDFKSALLHEFALMDHERGWVQQFHLGALRDTNTRLLTSLGPNTGFDSIHDLPQAGALADFLDGLDETDQLAKTILYNLNPRDNEMFATMIGNFQDGTTPGKMQYGAGWWFLDQMDGMQRQMNALSNMGLLSRFIGMLTDSRCFISYSRHEYFRRILCDLLGQDVARGHLPNDLKLLGKLVENICFVNAEGYFGFDS